MLPPSPARPPPRLHGMIPHTPLYPLLPTRAKRGGAPYGRTKYTDSAGRTNILLSTQADIRAALLSHAYDEADLKRSHISHAIGAWRLQNPTLPYPRVITQFLASASSRAALETTMQAELDAAAPTLHGELASARRRAA